jgi:hypothetical protein
LVTDHNLEETPEVPLVPDRDLEVLQTFDSRGQFTLSVYLRLDSPDSRESAYDEFVKQMQTRLDECAPQAECREAIKEDMEIVELYLQTNGHRRYGGLAIFSCAAELFWRAYPLAHAIPTRVTVGPRFDVKPLSQLTRSRTS